jgi:hypothetical protein
VSIPFLVHTSRNLETILMTVLPHGGQGSARKNAWGSMVKDNHHAKARREADLAMCRALEISQRQAAISR